MKNIALILTPVEFGGAEKVCLTFLKNVNRNLFNIQPIVLIRPWEKDGAFVAEIKKDGYEVIKVPVALHDLTNGHDYFRVFRCIHIITSILKNGSYDIVHTNGYFADIVGLIASKRVGTPIVSTCHGFIKNTWKFRLYNALNLVSLQFFNQIIAVSDMIKIELTQHWVRPSLITVIQNSVHVDSKKQPFIENEKKKKRNTIGVNNDDVILGYTGRLSEEKGIKYLIEASSILIETIPNIKLLILGDGPLRGELEIFTKQNGIESNVIFAGFQSDIENWMQIIDIFILPSLTEGTPMALLEAMAIGIPVVATRVGGVPQVINNNENGILVEPMDSQSIVQAINKIILDDSFRTKISKNAKKLIFDKYNIHDWCKQIERLYISIIEQRKKVEKN